MPGELEQTFRCTNYCTLVSANPRKLLVTADLKEMKRMSSIMYIFNERVVSEIERRVPTSVNAMTT
jgi:hypothetical protein